MRFSACKFPKDDAVGDENEGEMNKRKNIILRKFKDDDAMLVCFCWMNEEMDVNL